MKPTPPRTPPLTHVLNLLSIIHPLSILASPSEVSILPHPIPSPVGFAADSCNPRKILENPLYVSHVGKSMYAMQLERWFDLFGREKFKVNSLGATRGEEGRGQERVTFRRFSTSERALFVILRYFWYTSFYAVAVICRIFACFAVRWCWRYVIQTKMDIHQGLTLHTMTFHTTIDANRSPLRT